MLLISFLFLFAISLPVFSFDHSYTTYDKILNEAVIERGSQTAVDYEYLKINSDALDKSLSEIEAVSKNDFDTWNEDQKLAFLINSYNAFTLKLIVENYPGIDSIKDLGGFFSSPWDKKFFSLFGSKTNLDHLEHGLLRKNYNEPRIHFAINCASISCPALQKNAYVASKLDEQLEQAAIQFLRDTKHNRFNTESKTLEISSIFKWFSEDFTKAGSLKEYIARYISDDSKIKTQAKESVIKVVYLEYDWSLNKK
ncbi:MAG: DUF547 domain-containing protein [Gammaproteobacteria bacterium]